MSTETKVQPTPGPWRLTWEDGRPHAIESADGAHITYVDRSRYVDDRHDPVAEANAALIVRAVNAHDELVDTLRVIAESRPPRNESGKRNRSLENRLIEWRHEVQEMARDAIAKAEGEESG